MRFADPKQMMKSLGVVQDFVSPLALVTDSACEVQVVLDEALKEGTSWVGHTSHTHYTVFILYSLYSL
jgi:hypothetical protein